MKSKNYATHEKTNQSINPLVRGPLYLADSYSENFDFKRRDHRKTFQWASRQWVDRRLEPILDSALKTNGKQNSGTNGLKEKTNTIMINNNYPTHKKETIRNVTCNCPNLFKCISKKRQSCFQV